MQKNFENEIFKRMFLNQDQLLALSSLPKLYISDNVSTTQDQTNILNLLDKDYNLDTIYSDILLNQEEKELRIISYFTTKMVEDKEENKMNKHDLFIFSKIDLNLRGIINEKVKVLQRIRLDDEDKNRSIN